MYQRVRPEIDGVFPRILFRDRDDCRIAGQRDSGEGIHIVQFPGEGIDIPCRVCHLHVPVHLDVGSVPVEIKRVAPGFLGVGHQVHAVSEKELFAPPVVPSCLGRQHILVFPGIRSRSESGKGCFRLVFQGVGLDKDGIREHVDIRTEVESLYLRIVGAVPAFDDLPVLVPHRAAAEEYGHAVLGVVV